MRRRLLRTAVSLAAAATLLELLAWAVLLDCWPSHFLPQHYPHDSVGAQSGPVAASWETNSLGFRDREHPTRKPEGEHRIVCLGDSFLEGPQAVTMPGRLRELLRAERPEVEVLNFGRNGIGPAHYAQILTEVALEHEPDHVAVFFCVENDFVGLQDVDPAGFDEANGLFARFPKASWYGALFPRTTILLVDAWGGGLLSRWTSLPRGTRWGGTPVRTDTLERAAQLLTHYVAAPAEDILARLRGAMTPAEVAEFTQHAVPLELLALLTAHALGVPTTEHLLGGARTAWTDETTEHRQVEVAQELLRRMRDHCRARHVPFEVVLVPTSDADPEAADFYRRLGADDAPLFTIRRRQQQELARRLTADGVEVFDPSAALGAGSYLAIDTHWTELGAERMAAALAERWGR